MERWITTDFLQLSLMERSMLLMEVNWYVWIRFQEYLKCYEYFPQFK